MRKHLKKLISEFNELKTDDSKFRFLLEHKGIFKLNLDNDDTFVTVSDGILNVLGIEKYSVEEDDLNDLITNSFWTYLGWSEGVFILLDVVGIEAESV